VIQQLAWTYPLTRVCALWDFPRSTFYRRSSKAQVPTLRQALEQAATEWPTYGSRRLAAQLRRAGWKVNRKRIQRLMREMGLQRPKKRRKRRTTHSDHPFPRYPNLVQAMTLDHPDQVWVADLTYVHLRDEDIYLAVIMDVFTRRIRGWSLGHGLDEALTLGALRRALHQRQPEIHHSDQGVQYAATSYVNLLKSLQIQISMAEIGQATQNGYAERLIRTIKEEEVQLNDYQDYHDAYQHLGCFLDEVYTRKRIHSALGYLTPLEFESQWLAQHQSASVVL
jgi:putative transposase